MSSRRNFIKVGGIATLGFMGLNRWMGTSLEAAPLKATQAGYGPLIPDPKGILNLPKGFTYNLISRKGDKMDDGLLLPGAPDGKYVIGSIGGNQLAIIDVPGDAQAPAGVETIDLTAATLGSLVLSRDGTRGLLYTNASSDERITLVKLDEGHRRKLRDLGLLTRDARAVERKKPGRPGARKRFQFSKR